MSSNFALCVLCRQRQNGRRVHAVCQSEIPMPCAVAVAVYKNEKKTHTHTQLAYNKNDGRCFENIV